jgi:hypothetical protein
VTTSTSTGNKGMRTTYSQGPSGGMKKTTTYNTATGYVRKTRNLSPKSKKRKQKTKNIDLPLWVWFVFIIGLIIGAMF